MIRHPKVARDTARKGRTTAIITVGAMTVNAPAELREIPRWAHQSGAHQPLRPLPGLGDEHPHSLVEALTESTSTPLASTSTPRCAPYDAVLDDLTAQASPTLRDGIRLRSRPGGGDPHRVRRQPRTDPLRSRIRETLRHLPHPGIIRTNQPASSLPRRAPPSQRSALPSRHSTNAIPPTHHRLRRSPHHRRPHQEGHHPLPQTVPRPRGLPTRHGRPPNPTTPCPHPPNQYSTIGASTRSPSRSSPPLRPNSWTGPASPTVNQARSAVFDYIEGFYNPHRRHSAIGCHSPTDYERSTPTTL